MVDTNPYRIEEEKWTPNSVYEILPPNTVSWTNYQYSEGTDNVDTEKAHSSLLSGVVDFFGSLLGGVGKVLGGAVEFGVGVLGGIVEGVTGLIGGVARALGSIFGGGNNEQPVEPPEPIFNPIKTNLEGAIQPHLDRIDEAKELIDGATAEQSRIREDMAAQGLVGDEALAKAKQGIADAKTAQDGVEDAVGQLATVESTLQDGISDSVRKAEEAMAEIKSTNEALQANADATADLVADLQTDFSAEFEAITGRMDTISTEQSGLADGLSKAATQEDYNKLNEILWGEQVDLNQDQQALNKRRRDWEEGATLALEKLSDGAAAQTKWNQGAETAIDALARITGLNLGGRNYFLNSGGIEAPVTINSNSGSVYPITQGEDEHGAWVQGEYADGSGWILSTYANPIFESGYGTHYSPDFRSNKVPYTQSVEVMCTESVQVSLGSGGESFDLEPGVWTRVHRTITEDNLVRPNGINAVPLGDIPTTTRLYHRRWKLERGNQATDWTPAPEDLPTQAEVDELQNNAISKLETVSGTTVNTVDALVAAVDSIKHIQRLNDDLWEQQEIINKEQEERADMQEAMQKETLKVISRTIFHQNNQSEFDDYVEVNEVNGIVTVTAKDKPTPWVGNLISIGLRTSSTKVEGTKVSDTYPVIRQFSVPHETSRVIETGSTGSTRIDYWVQPGEMKILKDSLDLPYITGSRYVNDNYTTFHTLTVPKSQGTIAVRLSAKLLSADKGSTYGLRLWVTRPSTGSKARTWTRQTSNLGPLFPWGNGKRTWALYGEIDTDGTEDITIEMQGISSGDSDQSRVSGIDYRVTYIEGAEA